MYLCALYSAVLCVAVGIPRARCRKHTFADASAGFAVRPDLRRGVRRILRRGRSSRFVCAVRNADCTSACVHGTGTVRLRTFMRTALPPYPHWKDLSGSVLRFASSHAARQSAWRALQDAGLPCYGKRRLYCDGMDYDLFCADTSGNSFAAACHSDDRICTDTRRPNPGEISKTKRTGETTP